MMYTVRKLLPSAGIDLEHCLRAMTPVTSPFGAWPITYALGAVSVFALFVRLCHGAPRPLSLLMVKQPCFKFAIQICGFSFVETVKKHDRVCSAGRHS